MILSKNTNNKVSEVFVSFRTQLESKYKVEESEMGIETDLTNKHLSELICSLLEMDKKEVKFELLINNDFLRGSLKDHLLKHNMSQEEVIIINYILALPQPKLTSSTPQPDWIIDIHTNPLDNKDNYYSLTITGQLSVYSASHSVLHSQQLITNSNSKSLLLLDKYNSNDKIIVIGT